MAETIVNFFRELIGNDYVTIFIVSMIPFVEVRGSIPLAIAMGMNAFYAFLLAFAGSVIVGPILLAILHPIMNWLKKFKTTTKFVNKIENKILSKKDQIEKYGYIGLMLFVGIPLPGTGAWTGAGLAVLLNMNKKKSFLYIMLGVILASIIMSIISYGILGNIIK